MRSRIVVAVLLAALAASCTSDPDDAGRGSGPATATETGPSGPPAEPEPFTLRVMEFNVEYGGTGVDFDSVPEVIEASGADIVAIEEGYGNMPDIAASVGWEHYDPRTQVMSRYPLLTPPGNPPYVYVEVAPGSVVAVANVHLPSTSYGPFKVRDGAGADEVVAIEEHKRLAALTPTLESVEELAVQGVPVFLIGDFNAPSHRDWTEAAVGVRDHVRIPVAWPVSLAVEAAGLVDSYREAHPDPVADAGLTWPANRPIVPGYNPYRRGAPADRIDFVYAGGPIVTTESLLVGEEGGPDVDIAVTPWPTDHRATVSTFEVDPAPAPTIVSPRRRLVDLGDEVDLRFHAADGAGSIALVPAGGDPGADRLGEFGIVDDATSGDVAVPTTELRPGSYEAVLLSNTGAEIARTAFWVQEAGGEPVIGTTRPSYAVGDAVDVAWAYTPGNRWDWVGVYRRGADTNRASYLLWVHTFGTVEGSAVFDRDTVGAWPLPPGEYTVYLLRDDSYVALAGGDFTVR